MEQEDLLAYNTQKKKLILPEYGRNVHRMIEYCMSLEDRDERTRCANAIVNIMGNLFPHLRDVDDFKHKLWDHLAIMSDFKLDIDYPYEVIKKENLNDKPDCVPYTNSSMHYRHYGKDVAEVAGDARRGGEGSPDRVLGQPYEESTYGMEQGSCRR